MCDEYYEGICKVRLAGPLCLVPFTALRENAVERRPQGE